MSKFRVRKGQDAYVFYETDVEAGGQREANAIAGSRAYDGEWYLTGYTTYDDSVILDDEIDDVEPFTTLDHASLYCLTGPQRDAVLASLRLWQRMSVTDRFPEQDVFTNMGAHPGLRDDDIDALCEELNQ